MVSRQKRKHRPPQKPGSNKFIIIGGVVLVLIVLFAIEVPQQVFRSTPRSEGPPLTQPPRYQPTEKWLQRAYAIGERFHYVYTPAWEGANGAIGDAYLFAATGDSALLSFHADLRNMMNIFNGTWVDDRAWACLAEMYWWHFTGRTRREWVEDAKHRYLQARREGRLSNHEGYWTWYSYPPGAKVNDLIFTNSNMNQMVSVACWLYEATGEIQFLHDALLVWNGDGKIPGIEQTLYKGEGRWEGRGGRAAFGKELPWGGTSYCSIGAAMYRTTGDTKYREIAIATAKRILDPANGWVDAKDFYQLHMDGNGNFVHFLMDAYEIAPDELSDVPAKVERMLDHVWTNAHGTARVTLHREGDHGIRNGWSPFGGEDGYNVDEVGTVHAQSQAVRAFGVFAYFVNRKE